MPVKKWQQKNEFSLEFRYKLSKNSPFSDEIEISRKHQYILQKHIENNFGKLKHSLSLYP